MSNHRLSVRGFTLMEVMMVVLVVAISAVVVIPSSSSQDPISIQAASANLSGDLEYAQAASVADPSDPVVVWFDAPSNRYWLAKSSAPTAPIDRPGAPAGTKYDVRLNEMQGNSRLDLTVEGVGSYVRFDAMGRLQQTSDIVVTLSNDSGRIDMFIDAESGSVSAMADASATAAVTPGVFVDPAMVLRPEDETPAEAEVPPAPAAADAGVDPLQAVVSRTVDTLISSGGANATSSGTATIGGVIVGVTTAATTTTTAVTAAATSTVAATTTTVAATTTTAATTATNAVTTTTNAVATTTTTAVSTTTNTVSAITGGLLGSGSSGSGSSSTKGGGK